MSDAPTRDGLPDLVTAELPAPPASTWRIIGPGAVAAGVGLASGEFILYPYIASQVGLAFVWAAAVGLATQYFINMEIERYTLATGETVLTGFSRLGRHWGLVFVLLAFASNLWPGWATGAATLTTWLVGGSVRWIAIGMLVAIGLILTLSPIVYRSLERAQFLKLAAVAALLIVAARRRNSGAGMGGNAGPDRRVRACPRPSWVGRSCSAPSLMPAPAAPRICASPTGSATRASAWARTRRVSSAR